jgi:hypothetical protein
MTAQKLFLLLALLGSLLRAFLLAVGPRVADTRVFAVDEQASGPRRRILPRGGRARSAAASPGEGAGAAEPRPAAARPLAARSTLPSWSSMTSAAC